MSRGRGSREQCLRGHVDPPRDKHSSCIPCTRERHYRRQAEAFALKGNACLDCGNTDSRLFEFDHRENKVTAVSMLLTYKWEHVLAEIAKCDLVCANCHKLREWKRRQSD